MRNPDRSNDFLTERDLRRALKETEWEINSVFGEHGPIEKLIAAFEDHILPRIQVGFDPHLDLYYVTGNDHPFSALLRMKRTMLRTVLHRVKKHPSTAHTRVQAKNIVESHREMANYLMQKGQLTESERFRFLHNLALHYTFRHLLEEPGAAVRAWLFEEETVLADLYEDTKDPETVRQNEANTRVTRLFIGDEEDLHAIARIYWGIDSVFSTGGFTDKSRPEILRTFDQHLKIGSRLSHRGATSNFRDHRIVTARK